ncbi:MAG: cbb3-type cytochrome c oxidase subunit 3 [Acetobacteraceae bacterium]|nr:cbb3-type cytochrome c oxidase subunit 3 [Acetobacteraceae bacterium]
MAIDHDTLVKTAKSWGLFYLIALSFAVLVYAFWPSNRKRFDRARKSILDPNDRPGE